jgi:hypothetical protein
MIRTALRLILDAATILLSLAAVVYVAEFAVRMIQGGF